MRYSESLERATRRREGPIVEAWTDERFREARDEDLKPATQGPWAVVRATFACLVVAALLTSGSLVEIAERQPFGASRDRWLGLAEGVDRVANFLSLNRPADLIAQLRGSASDEALTVDTIGEDLLPAAGTPATPDTPAATGPDPAAGADPGAGTGAVAETPATTAPPTTTVPPRAYRTVTVEQPLQVYVAGDSQAEFLGQALVNVARDRGGLLAVANDFRISTGLARPDYFNWPAQLAGVLAAPGVEAVVFQVGGNDTQDMELDGVRIVEGTPEWQAEYQRRAAITMDLVSGEGRHLFWVLQAPARDAGENVGVGQLNQAVRDAAATRQWVTILPADVLVANPDGSYADDLTTDTGRVERVRQRDGVHLTREGSAWVARVLYDQIGGVWPLVLAPPPLPPGPSAPPAASSTTAASS